MRNDIIEDMEKTKLSVTVKALRKEYGLTQEDLATIIPSTAIPKPEIIK